MYINSQSEGISSPLALSQLQYKQTLFHNRKHNYCFKCVRISRHHKSVFEIQKKMRLVVTLTSTQVTQRFNSRQLNREHNRNSKAIRPVVFTQSEQSASSSSHLKTKFNASSTIQFRIFGAIRSVLPILTSRAALEMNLSRRP